MKISISISALVFLILTECLSAQDQPQLTVTYNPAGCSLDWYGLTEHTYFIQWSEDLTSWSFFPTIRSGNGVDISHGFSCTAPKFFLRLKYTDLPDGGDADTADFDSDGVPNLFELTSNPQSDPLDANDTGGDGNGNGLQDNWEAYYFGGLGIADPNAILGNDGLTNREKSELGLDPNENYSQNSTSHTSSYTYDLTGRVLTSSGSLTASTFTYDSEGNILTNN